MYTEGASPLPYVTAWRRVIPPGADPGRILPDGCLDLVWHEGRVFVAGPDTLAQVYRAPAGDRVVGLRFASGTGPGVLGVPADELTDRRVPLADLWPAAAVRRIAEAADPLAALVAASRPRYRPPDREMVALATAARAGLSVGVAADRCGLSSRQLQRRSRRSFGYGPKTLHRVLRLGRAVGLARGGLPLSEVAAVAGYADQAHLSREVRALTGVALTDLLAQR